MSVAFTVKLYSPIVVPYVILPTIDPSDLRDSPGGKCPLIIWYETFIGVLLCVALISISLRYPMFNDPKSGLVIKYKVL